MRSSPLATAVTMPPPAAALDAAPREIALQLLQARLRLARLLEQASEVVAHRGATERADLEDLAAEDVERARDARVVERRLTPQPHALAVRRVRACAAPPSSTMRTRSGAPKKRSASSSSAAARSRRRCAAKAGTESTSVSALRSAMRPPSSAA